MQAATPRRPSPIANRLIMLAIYKRDRAQRKLFCSDRVRRYHWAASRVPLHGVTMLDRWRLAIVLALFGFLASGALIVSGSMGSNSDLETRLGWVIDVACP